MKGEELHDRICKCFEAFEAHGIESEYCTNKWNMITDIKTNDIRPGMEMMAQRLLGDMYAILRNTLGYEFSDIDWLP